MYNNVKETIYLTSVYFLLVCLIIMSIDVITVESTSNIPIENLIADYY